MTLPIESVLPTLLDCISKQDCILSAPPGAGKSTLLPLRLLEHVRFSNKQILLLQPRQVAVRSVAHYLAEQLNEKVGQRVGYQMRGESAVSKSTRLCVITEGLLIAKLQSDPELSDTAIVIFDEFHERSVFSDIALGLCLEVQQGLREDLRLLVMSATLNSKELAPLMPHAKQLKCDGRQYSIRHEYRPYTQQQGLKQALLSTIDEAINQHAGNILVFLPGVALIHQLLKELALANYSDVDCLPLHGSLPLKQQNQAIARSKGGIRKLILATNIAETSITIDQLSIVIDSGREKILKLNIPRKTNQLNEQFISKASSIQRAGRAGRQQAGLCFRLWSAEQQDFLVEHPPAPISQVDVSQFLLILLEWGSDFNQLPLIDRPSKAQIDYALDILTRLRMIDSKQTITQTGKQAARFNTDVRLACILAYACELSPSKKLICAALISFTQSNPQKLLTGINTDEDLRDLVVCIRYLTQSANTARNRQLLMLRQDIQRWSARLGLAHSQSRIDGLQIGQAELTAYIVELLVQGFPDKIGQRNKHDNYLFVDGSAGTFNSLYNINQAKSGIKNSRVNENWIIATKLQVSDGAYSSIQQFVTIPSVQIDKYLNTHAETKSHQFWDSALDKIVQKRERRLGAIVIESQAESLVYNSQTLKLLISEIYRRSLQSIFESSHKKALQIIDRMKCANIIDGEALMPAGLKEKAQFASLLLQAHSEQLNEESYLGLEQNIASFLENVYSWKQVQSIDWYSAIRALLTWEQQSYLDSYFPTHFVSALGNKHAIDYSKAQSAQVAIRVQELYGAETTPNIGKTKQPLTLSLLSPAHREVQKTSDLKRFWLGSYKEVQKDMKSRYPKHFWPDNPQLAKPTLSTKKHM